MSGADGAARERGPEGAPEVPRQRRESADPDGVRTERDDRPDLAEQLMAALRRGC